MRGRHDQTKKGEGMRHGSLFSGIGGFDLAAEYMGWENCFHVEKDLFCQAVLKKHFPQSEAFDDVKKFNGLRWHGAIDILTGGFPCQPYSVAGKRRGKEDDRALWPEMLRVISEIRPTWVVGENVAGFINMGFDSAASDLESEGYEVQAFVIPACAIGAPHRRDRIWIVAHTESNGQWSGRIKRDIHETHGGQDGSSRSKPTGANCKSENMAHVSHAGCELQSRTIECKANEDENGKGDADFTKRSGGTSSSNANGSRLEGRELNGINDPEGRKNKRRSVTEFDPNENWIETATYLCGKNYGLPGRMDRFKSLGNAIVPGIAYQIFKAIEAVK